MQIKLFSNTCIKDLEKEVNQFLTCNMKYINLRQISHSESDEFCTVMIVYETE